MQIHPAPRFSMPDAALFVSTVDVGSFTAAAHLHELSPSAVSKAVRRLEDELGVRLLVRSTRRLQVTDEGALFHERCQAGMRLMNEGAELATETHASLRGVLRIGVPPSLQCDPVPEIAMFLDAHPQLSIDSVMLTDVSRFYEMHVDCALVAGVIVDPSLAGRELDAGTMLTVAAPAYLARRGVPQAPADLGAHDCIGQMRANGDAIAWRFHDHDAPDQEIRMPVRERLRFDDPAGAARCAAQGLGIAQVPLFFAMQGLLDRQLVRLMPALESRAEPSWIVFPAQRVQPRRVRVFVDFVVLQWQAKRIEASMALAAEPEDRRRQREPS